jgi:uncharacterized protein YdhG (YjbR/CyaY superfamily)
MTDALNTEFSEIRAYHTQLEEPFRQLADVLFDVICSELPDAQVKIWHAHPVWFLDGNPIVGYSKQKRGLRLMFWSGADFQEEDLSLLGKKFKDASIIYNHLEEVQRDDLIRYLQKARSIQWDYKNIVKRKGKLMKLS